MKQKRFLSLFLVVVMMLGSVSTQAITLNATEKPTFSVSSGMGNPGEDITLTVDISNNPGICTATIWVHYDEGLTLKSATDSRLLVGGLFGGDKTANPYGLGWDDSANFDGDNSSNGTIATLVFSIDSSASAGDYNVWITYNHGDIYNLDFDDFEFECVAGKITVAGAVCGHINTEIRDASSASCDEDGYTGDTWCKDCNTKIASGERIPATGDHVDADGKWESNDVQHFHTCACGAEFDNTNHSGGTATCKDKAKCSVCGTIYGNLNSSNHVNTEIRDASSASCDEDGYTGDTWCKDCNTKIASGERIPATGDHVDADGKWESNDVQHFHTCACGAEFDNTNHSGGTATCKDKAKCSVCGAAYGNLNGSNHVNTEIRDASSASCDEDGYTGDTWCKDCDTKIASGERIPATGDHVDADGKWEGNDVQHFHTCACGTEFDNTNHSGGTATCKDKAKCSVCGTVYGNLNSSNHVNTEIRDASSASCDEDGYTGDIWCKDCNTKIASGERIPATGDHVDSDGKWESNDVQHFHTCACGTEFDNTNHSGGTATCKDKAKCSVCGTVYGNLNSSNHVNTEIRDASSASCDEDGYTGDTWCKDCETKIADGDVIPAAHKTTKVPAVNATHFENGNIEYFACSNCEKLFADEKATTEIKLEDTVVAKGEHSYGEEYEKDADNHWKQCGCGNMIEKSAHTFGEWATIKEATESEKGSKEKTCSVCGYKVTEEIPVVEGDDKEDIPNTDPNSPQTGDTSNLPLWIALLIVSGCCLTVCTVSNRRKKHNR